MKKVFISVMSAALLGGTIFSLTGCGTGGSQHGVEGTLKISIFEGGNGNTAFHKLAEAYKAHNPEAKIEVNYDPLVRETCQTAVETGETDSDIFFIDGCTVQKGVEEYDSILDISELYSMKPKAGDNEESITIGEKIRPEISNLMKYQGDIDEFKGKYYTAPWASGPASIILNKTALNNTLGVGNWSKPKTSKELIELCNRIVAADATVSIKGATKKVYPFIYGAKAEEYWRYMYYTWIAQLMGLDRFDSEYLSVKLNGEYNMEAYFPKEKAQGLNEFEKIIKRSNGFCDEDSASIKFMDAQTYFMQGRACMLVTGDWFEREMEGTSYNPDLEMIRTPMISSFADTYSEKFGSSLGSTDVEKDSKLSSIIEAVDNGATSFDGLTPEQFDFIKQRRGYTYSLASSSYCIVPKCTVNKDLAIDFLRFFYSDEGIQITLDDTKSLLPVINPENYQINGEVSDFRKSVNKIYYEDNFHFVCFSDKDPIRYRAGLKEFMSSEKPEVALGKKSGALTADRYLEIERRLLKNDWENFMRYVK